MGNIFIVKKPANRCGSRNIVTLSVYHVDPFPEDISKGLFKMFIHEGKEIRVSPLIPPNVSFKPPEMASARGRLFGGVILTHLPLFHV
jgi:hypothetical protein